MTINDLLFKINNYNKELVKNIRYNLAQKFSTIFFAIADAILMAYLVTRSRVPYICNITKTVVRIAKCFMYDNSSNVPIIIYYKLDCQLL